MTSRQRFFSLLRFAGELLVLPLLAVSCIEPDPVRPCPPERIGAVEGILLVGGLPTVAPIGARCAEGLGMGEVRFRTVSDSTGWYRLEMPIGPYRIEVDPSSGGYFPVRDTIRVGIGVRRLDLFAGRGTVRLHLPAPFAGVRTSLRLNDQTVDAVVAEDGWVEFGFPLVSLGRYPLRLTLPSGQFIQLAGAGDPGVPDSVTIPGDRPFAHERDLSNWATISGRIKGSWMELDASSPIVSAWAAGDSTLCSSTRSETDGRFLLAIPVPQAVKLQTEIRPIVQWIGSGSYEDATVFQIEPGARITGIESAESGIECALEGPGDFSTHDPRIILLDDQGHSWQPYEVGSRTPICNLRPGRYFLRVDGWCAYRSQTWANQWYDGAAELVGATPIEIGEGEAVTITFHLAEGSAISGCLLDAAGVPAGGIYFWFHNHDSLPVADLETLACRSRASSDDGSFEFTGLADGAYTFAADRHGKPDWWYPGTEDQDSAEAVIIRDGIAVTGLEWRLPPQ